jgi:hypothetical protein
MGGEGGIPPCLPFIQHWSASSQPTPPRPTLCVIVGAPSTSLTSSLQTRLSINPVVPPDCSHPVLSGPAPQPSHRPSATSTPRSPPGCSTQNAVATPAPRPGLNRRSFLVPQVSADVNDKISLPIGFLLLGYSDEPSSSVLSHVIVDNVRCSPPHPRPLSPKEGVKKSCRGRACPTPFGRQPLEQGRASPTPTRFFHRFKGRGAGGEGANYQ